MYPEFLYGNLVLYSVRKGVSLFISCFILIRLVLHYFTEGLHQRPFVTRRELPNSLAVGCILAISGLNQKDV